eukprot:6291435-Pyramimonas_sp.AAC.1
MGTSSPPTFGNRPPSLGRWSTPRLGSLPLPAPPQLASVVESGGRLARLEYMLLPCRAGELRRSDCFEQ